MEIMPIAMPWFLFKDEVVSMLVRLESFVFGSMSMSVPKRIFPVWGDAVKNGDGFSKGRKQRDAPRSSI